MVIIIIIINYYLLLFIIIIYHLLLLIIIIIIIIIIYHYYVSLLLLLIIIIYYYYYYYYYYYLSSSSSSLLSPSCKVFTVLYLKQTMYLGYIVLQLFCTYNLRYMLCYFAREVCLVLLHQHLPQFVRSAQYGCFLWFFNFELSRYVAQLPSE